jgi:hypothetical protein
MSVSKRHITLISLMVEHNTSNILIQVRVLDKSRDKAVNLKK